MKRKESIAVLMVILPLLFGTAIYVFLRPDTYISELIGTALHVNAAPADCPRGMFSDFLRFYVSDMLWAFALPPALFAATGFEADDLLHIFFISVAFAGSLEMLQYIGVMSGTGDLVDLILESIAVSAAVFTLKIVFGGQIYEKND